MNIGLWILQVLLALHTVMGALWKFSNDERSVPSLSTIPHGMWTALSIVELFCAVALLAPAASRRLGRWVPVATGVIAAEMLLFCVVFLLARATTYGELVYWIVVAAFCAFLIYGRAVLRPIKA
jgi:hypothetical protein